MPSPPHSQVQLQQTSYLQHNHHHLTHHSQQQQQYYQSHNLTINNTSYVSHCPSPPLATQSTSPSTSSTNASQPASTSSLSSLASQPHHHSTNTIHRQGQKHLYHLQHQHLHQQQQLHATSASHYSLMNGNQVLNGKISTAQQNQHQPNLSGIIGASGGSVVGDSGDGNVAGVSNMDMGGVSYHHHSQLQQPFMRTQPAIMMNGLNGPSTHPNGIVDYHTQHVLLNGLVGNPVTNGNNTGSNCNNNSVNSSIVCNSNNPIPIANTNRQIRNGHVLGSGAVVSSAGGVHVNGLGIAVPPATSVTTTSIGSTIYKNNNGVNNNYRFNGRTATGTGIKETFVFKYFSKFSFLL